MDSLKTRRIKKRVAPYLLIAPAATLVAIFAFGVINGVMQSLGIMPFLGSNDLTFDNYAKAFSNPNLVQSILYSLYLAAFSALIALVGGVALSAALTRLKASRTFQLMSIQIPIMTAHVLVVVFVVSIFAGSGLFPRFLHLLGLIDSPSSFASVVGDPSGWGILLTYAWKEIPFIAFCTIAIMANVSNRYGEAAATLGASSIRTFFNVTLPLCKNAITKAFLVVFAFAFGAYEVPYLLGPTLPKALPVLAYLEFQNPDILNRGYAMAINGIMALICTILVIIYVIVLHREKKAQDGQ